MILVVYCAVLLGFIVHYYYHYCFALGGICYFHEICNVCQLSYFCSWYQPNANISFSVGVSQSSVHTAYLT